MRSSTSSSRDLRLCLLITAVSFSSTIVLAAAAWSLPALRDHRVLEAEVDRPPPSYYQVSATQLFGQHVFFHELYPVRGPLQRAEVLLLGNSNTLVALPDSEIGPFFREHDLSYYHLGFANARADFARMLFDKYELKPRLVIVNADYFFVPGLSRWAEDATHDSYFDAEKRRFELRAQFEARRWVHTLLPHPVGRDLEGAEVMVYRSIERGDWLTTWNQTRPAGANVRRGPSRPSHSEILMARTFKRELEEVGAQLILTWVPTHVDGRPWARRFARELDVPLINPRLDGLRTIDGSHLDPASAARFSKAFLAELEPLLP